jgi:hypothetical protein
MPKNSNLIFAILFLFGILFISLADARIINCNYDNASSIWHFDNNSLDYCKGINGTNTLITYTLGNYNFSSVFGNGTSLINFNNNYNFERNNSFSYTFWTKLSNQTTSPPNSFIIKQATSLGNYSGLEISINGNSMSSNITIYLTSNLGTNNYLQTLTPVNIICNYNNLSLCPWTFLTITYDGSSNASGLKVYVNSVLKNSTIVRNTLSGSILNSASLNVGKRLQNAQIDEMGVFNRTLNQEEISSLYADFIHLSVYFPITNYYNQNMNINYTSAISGYNISYYNISLVNVDLSHNQTITLNNSLNLGYIYNTTEAVDGYYYVKVTACDINQDCNSSYSELIVIDNTAPFGSLNSPLNNTFTNETLQNFSISVTDNYNLSNLTLFIYNSSNDLINQTIVQTNESSGTFSILYQFLVVGVYHWFYSVFDEVGNLFETMIYTLNIIPPYLSVTITSPTNNTNYSYSISSMTYITSGISSCWYSLNQGQTNISVVCNNPIVNITSQNGINIWRVYANNSIGNETYDEVIFNSTCINPDVTMIVPTYPYVEFNTTYTIKLSPFALGNSNIKLEILNDNSIYNFIYNNTTQEYELSFIFTNETDYNFVIYGDGICPTIDTNITGTFLVRKPFYVTFRGFISKENATWFHTNKYLNNFAYVTAELTGTRTMFTNNYDTSLEPFFAPSRDSRFSKPVWYSSYSDGEATIKLYEQGEYAIRLIDGQITFSGDYAIPNITESYGINVYLGKYALTNSSSYNILFQEKDLHPFTWLFNWVYIILLVLIILVGAILFFAMPDNVAFSSVFVIGGIIALTLLRIILWVVGY